MNEIDTSVGIDSLIKPTTTMVNITLASNNTRLHHVEYLPYPDDRNLDAIECSCSDGKKPLNEIFSKFNQVFVDGVPVEITEIVAERTYNPVSEFLNPYLYTISVRYGTGCEWKIKKRHNHFHDLHKALVRYVESELGRSISTLIKRQLSEKRSDINEDEATIKTDDQPCFPTRNDRVSFINQFTIADRCKTLQNYLNKVLKHPKFREQTALHEFFEVSPLSFVHGISSSYKEGAISKRSNDDFRGRSVCLRVPFMCDACKVHRGQRWFALKDTYLTYIRFETGVIGFPMLIDQAFASNRGFKKTATNNGLRLENLQRVMTLKFKKDDDRNEWRERIIEVKDNCEFSKKQPFNSYAPRRTKQYAQWFINGQPFMEAVANAILAAKEEIFITDWWLSPEVLLVRPCADQSMRLDNLLGKRAEEGIRIYVMVFKDIVQVVGLNSWYTKVKLTNKSPTKRNIKVIRHPNHSVAPGTESSFFYSHHEKTFIIDQRVAFISGIDLCWGRWDTEEYRLVDLGDENVRELKLPSNDNADQEEPASETSKIVASIISTMISDELTNQSKSTEEEKEKLLKSEPTSSPVADETKDDVTNLKVLPPVTDFYSELNKIELGILALEEGAEQRAHRNRKQWRKLVKRVRHKNNEDSSDEDEELPPDDLSDVKPKPIDDNATPIVNSNCRYFVGKDYSNAYEKDCENVDQYAEDNLDRKTTTRMPWHDEGLVVTGEAARDCARHFIQRWNVHKADKLRFNDAFPYILPKSYDDPELLDTSMLCKILGENQKPICVDAQCVRSVASWSCGTRTVENSIQNAYVHMIESAQHYIFIENQFFISIANDKTIKNNISSALIRRISRANLNKENFRVYVVLPLLPGFSGVNAIQAVMYYTMRSINKGETSLYQSLIKEGVQNPQDYIMFYGMRNWDILMGKLVTEIIYVHSKLMIVDDRMCICGSANINDRSLQGYRDSEFCLFVNDTELIDSKLNGQIQKVGRFCSTWRKKLFRQLLGIKDENDPMVDDPCSAEFFEYVRRLAKTNGEIYEEVFKTMPSDNVRTFEQCVAHAQKPKLAETDPLAAHEKCKQIQGYIVDFPLEFLADDTILPKLSTSEGMAPVLLWT